jgi:hypothetical protein
MKKALTEHPVPMEPLLEPRINDPLAVTDAVYVVWEAHNRVWLAYVGYTPDYVMAKKMPREEALAICREKNSTDPSPEWSDFGPFIPVQTQDWEEVSQHGFMTS